MVEYAFGLEKSLVFIIPVYYERCNFVDPLMFHNNTPFYETIGSTQYYLIQID